MKKSLILFFLIITAGFSNSASLKFYKVNSEIPKDSTGRKSLLNFNLSQIVYGELRVSYEKQQQDNLYLFYGIGLVYLTDDIANAILGTAGFAIRSKNYKGISLFLGQKVYLSGNVFVSNEFFIKYERDDGFMLRYLDSYSLPNARYIFFIYRENLFRVGESTTRDKFVFGEKVLLGQTKKISSKVSIDYYTGFGVRFIREVFWNKDIQIEANKIKPSVHLGLSISFGL